MVLYKVLVFDGPSQKRPYKRMETYIVVYRESDEERSSETCLGGGGAQRSVLHVDEHKKTGALSTRARSAPKTGFHPLNWRSLLSGSHIVKYRRYLQ
jgi:hypothetical protein